MELERLVASGQEELLRHRECMLRRLSAVVSRWIHFKLLGLCSEIIRETIAKIREESRSGEAFAIVLVPRLVGSRGLRGLEGHGSRSSKVVCFLGGDEVPTE